LSNVSDLQVGQQQANRQVARFVGRFKPDYRLLAYYAALPLVLTPELLHYLRIQFLQGKGVPWVAEVDLLLSDLCQPVGYEQYAMDTTVRAYLLEEMEQRLGQDQMVRAAHLLIRYVEQLERTNPYLSQQQLEAQHLAALLVLDEEQAVRQVTTAYLQAGSPRNEGQLSVANQVELARLSSLIQELAPQIKRHENLVKYAELIGQLLRNPNSVNSERLQQSFPILDDLELRVPDGLLPDLFPHQPEGFPPLLTAEFNVATIAFEADATSPVILLQPFQFTVATIEDLLLTTLDLGNQLDAIDEAIFQQKGQHLTEIERAVLEGTLLNQTYEQIAQQIKNEAINSKIIGRELWQLLSSIFGEKITKTNLSAALKRWLWQKSISHEQREGQQFIEDLSNDIYLEMVKIPEGGFVMGSPENELERSTSEGRQHTVTLQLFFLGKYPVTQAQWQIVAAFPQVNRELAPDPSRFKGKNRPVENVSWLEAVEFCDRLSQHTGRQYRLPSEAEWEYACRAGTTTPFHFGEMITTDLANYNGNYTYGKGPKGIDRKETTAVGSFGMANAFGLYDMHGNVWEWCIDHWHENYKDAPIDGSAWINPEAAENDSRLLRGGSWYDDPRNCRSAYRLWNNADHRFNYFGFRVACSA
jgi:formylglycine-generating enzyme required for sulfatase activity/cell division protein ZapA (FtsZ GTPase activity inhibitor)